MAWKMIGIRGHRGAGKNTLSYLLGAAIEHYTRQGSFDGFNETYSKAVERCRQDETFIDDANMRNVHFESFADTPKILITELIGVPSEWAYDDWCKDSVLIRLDTFETQTSKDKLELASRLKSLTERGVLHDADTIKSAMDQGGEVWATLREVISYFSHFMRDNLGTDVWIKALKANKWDRECFFTGNKTKYKIFTDCKFPSEISYIKDAGGCIVKVTREDNVKPDTNISSALTNDDRHDFTFEMQADLYAIEEDIKTLATKILQYDSRDSSFRP